MNGFLKKLANSDYALPVIIVILAMSRIWMPQLPANQGLGWDGYKYYSMTIAGLQSEVLDSYLLLRIFPCILIGSILKLLSMPLDPSHVIMGFKVMNTILIGLSAVMVKQIFKHYHINPATQLTGFVLIYLNYAVLNFTYYYPVMTDTPAFFISVALLYFFIFGQSLNIALMGLIGAFTWPTLLPMAIALLLFPRAIAHQPTTKAFNYITSGLVIAALIAFITTINTKTDENHMAYTLPISAEMLWVSVITVCITFIGGLFILRNKNLYSLPAVLAQLTIKRIIAALALIVIPVFTLIFLQPKASPYTSLYTQLYFNIRYALERPFMSLVCHANYYGAIILLLIVFWKRFSIYLSSWGLGIVIPTLFTFLIVFIKPESRALIYFMPWLMILMTLYLSQFQFSKFFYTLIFLINLIASKLWLIFDYNASGGILADGTIDFPQQWFYMNLGIWMTEQVWFFLIITIIISLALLMLSLYRIQSSDTALLFYSRFQSIKSNESE